MKQHGLLIGSAVGAVGVVAAILFGWAWYGTVRELKSLQELSAAEFQSLKMEAARDATDTEARSLRRREAHRRAREEKAELEREKAALADEVVGGKLATALQHEALRKLTAEKRALEDEKAQLKEEARKTSRLLERAENAVRSNKKDARGHSSRAEKLLKERDALRRTLQRQRDQSDEIDRLLRERNELEFTITTLLNENRYLKALYHRRHRPKEE
ncbi:MAG: hypothetical protein ACYTFI_05510 [Planctomycetota bacterium]|jgi:hypothetical protein